jgi:hypothetical protein
MGLLIAERWLETLQAVGDLKPGWNGHAAPAPAADAVRDTRLFLAALAQEGLEPTRLAPSAVGGVAVTRREGDRKVLVEFLNNGRVHALFADDATSRCTPARSSRPTRTSAG